MDAIIDDIRRVSDIDLASKGRSNSISFNEKSHCDDEY